MRLISSANNRTTPVAQRSKDGIFVGHDGDAWLYRIMENVSLQWRDLEARQQEALRWLTLFMELSTTSSLGAPGTRKLRRHSSKLREFHLLKVAWDERPEPPEASSPLLADWQRSALENVSCGASIVAFGVKLRRSAIRRASGLKAHVSELADSARGHEIDLTSYNTDLSFLHETMRRAGGRVPTREEARRLEYWWNGGRGSDATIVLNPDGRSLSCSAWPEGLEFSAIIDYANAQLDPHKGLWLNDVFSGSEGCVCVSVRGDIHPAGGIDQLFRRTRRKARSNAEETAATGDVSRGEDRALGDTAEDLEEYFNESREALLQSCSFIFARRNSEATHTYADELQQVWGLDTKVLEFRQHPALMETLPCGPAKFRWEKPFAQDVSIGALAVSGIASFSEVGDSEGAFVGLALSDQTPIWLDPLGAGKANTSPATLIVGEPGGGKTFLMQSAGSQFALDGWPVVLLNPKPGRGGSLIGFAEAIGGETIWMSSTEQNPGALDPFRFARTPADAAEIAASHIASVIDLDQLQELDLSTGLMRAAVDDGARCVGEALQHELIPNDVRVLIERLCESKPLFSQGISQVPRAPLGTMADADALERGEGSLTLVEFDRQLNLPETANRAGHNLNERIAMAAVRLVCVAALERMLAVGGGVLMVDEAHVLLGSEEGAKILTRLGREGRSQRILPVLATQRLQDVMEGNANLESYISRAIVLKMRAHDEALAAFRLLKLDATPKRMEWLANAGPIRGVRGPLGFFRDLEDRVSGFTVSEMPDHIHALFSTNPLDRADGPVQSREKLLGAAT